MKSGIKSPGSPEELSADDIVRHKLMSRGAEALTDQELLSIIVLDGKGGTSALGAAALLLADNRNSLIALARRDISYLRRFNGLGLARACVLAASLELGRRRQMQQMVIADRIASSKDITDMFVPQLGMLDHEEFWVVYLNNSNRIVESVRVGQGGTAGVTVDNKIIIRGALDRLASSLILVHNHPSGNSLPSTEDVALTARLKEAAQFFDIRLSDHVIITDGECYSFKANGVL